MYIKKSLCFFITACLNFKFTSISPIIANLPILKLPKVQIWAQYLRIVLYNQLEVKVRIYIMGNLIINVVPLPNSVSKLICPFSFSTIPLLMARPRPVPEVLVVKLG